MAAPNAYDQSPRSQSPSLSPISRHLQSIIDNENDSECCDDHKIPRIVLDYALAEIDDIAGRSDPEQLTPIQLRWHRVIVSLMMCSMLSGLGYLQYGDREKMILHPLPMEIVERIQHYWNWIEMNGEADWLRPGAVAMHGIDWLKWNELNEQILIGLLSDLWNKSAI